MHYTHRMESPKCDQPRLTALVRTLYWNLAMLNFRDRPRVRTRSNAVNRGRPPSTACYRRRRRATAVDGFGENVDAVCDCGSGGAQFYPLAAANSQDCRGTISPTPLRRRRHSKSGHRLENGISSRARLSTFPRRSGRRAFRYELHWRPADPGGWPNTASYKEKFHISPDYLWLKWPQIQTVFYI